MIIDHDHKWIYVGCPKTGTQSIQEWLMTDPDGKARIRTEDPHQVRTPKGLESYFHWATVRNPYDRAVSLWKYYRKELGQLAFTFDEFAEMLPNMNLYFPRWFPHVSQDTFFGNQRLNFVVKLEELDTGMVWLGRKIPLPGTPIPHMNHIDGAPWISYYNEVSLGNVCLWARDDFERFGYPA